MVLARKNLANKQQSVHNAIYVFCVSVSIGKENFSEWVMICQFFPYQNFPVYGTTHFSTSMDDSVFTT